MKEEKTTAITVYNSEPNKKIREVLDWLEGLKRGTKRSN